MRTERRRLLLIVPAAVLVAMLVFAVIAFLRAQHSLSQAAVETRHAQELSYTLQPFDPATFAASNPGFEPVAAPARWTSGTQLGNELFLAGPSGLAEYSSGSLVHLWRTGLDLPASPITMVTTGRLRGASEPQVLIATAGAGVFLLAPGPHPAFAHLLPSDPAARDLATILPTATGDLLLGTRRAGLLIFSGATLTRQPIHLPGLDGETVEITALAASGSAVLIGTRNAGAVYLNAGVAARFTAANGLPDDDVVALATSSTHAYLGTPVGVAELDLASARITRTLAPGLFARTLAVTAGALTIGTVDQGLHTLSLDRQPRLRTAGFHPSLSQDAQPVEQVVSTSSGLLALTGDSILENTGTGWVSAFASPSATLTDPNISALLLAPDGRLWVGLFDRGLDILGPDMLSPGSLHLERHLEDDRLFCLDRLALDPVRQTVAAGTANGLVLFDRAGTPRQTLTQHDGLIADHINDLVFTPSGLALATPAGITFLNADGPESLYAFQGLVNNHVYTLAASADGRSLLAGTLGGLSLLESEQVRRSITATNSSLGHNWITAAIPQGPGRWLVGTYGAGLEYVTLNANGEPRANPADLPAGAPRNLVINPNALLETPTAIYAGTLGNGLLVYNRAARRWSLVQRGLPSLNVTSFAAGAGTLFIGTENGLVRVAESRLVGPDQTGAAR